MHARPECICDGHPFQCYKHPNSCGCAKTALDRDLRDRLLRALDWAATFKLAGGEREFAILAEKIRATQGKEGGQ